jgi:hypothetical protein
MPQTIDETLRGLDHWFNEPSEGGDRPKLLSKLALLELCGWLEGYFDALIFRVNDLSLQDRAWTTSISARVSGFEYEKHFRGMLVMLVGEVTARRIESAMEAANPGDLDRLKQQLRELWRKRCNIAHSDMVANIASQTTFDAPSWAINQHRELSKLLDKYKNSLEATLSP